MYLPLLSYLIFFTRNSLDSDVCFVCSFVVDCVGDVSCGHNHTVAVSAGGRVFTWGDNTHRQCGVLSSQIVDHPQYIPVLTHSDRTHKPSLSESQESTESRCGGGDCSRRDITNVTDGLCTCQDCCHRHTCHASDTGCSGVLLNAKIVRVSCGRTHTAVLSNCGQLWAWGSGIQVGVADTVSVPVPYPIEFPASRQVINVSCGGYHTIAVTVRNDADKTVAAAADKPVTNDVSKTASTGENTTESITLSKVPPEAKKHAARQSSSSKQKTDSNSSTKSDDAASEGVNKATDADIPMQRLTSSSSRESGKDNAETDGATCEFVSTCIDEVFPAGASSNGDLPANVYSENCVSLAAETVDNSSTASNVLNIPTARSSSASHASSSSVPKSRSSFLDETEAIIFLEKQLSDSTGSVATADRSSKEKDLTKVEKKDVQDIAPSMSPFAKTVESLLQHVPSSPVVQEYVSNLTRTVVSNLRTSVDRRLNYVTSQVEVSMRNIASLNKVAEAGDTEVTAALDDTVLLERLALSNGVSTLLCSVSSAKYLYLSCCCQNHKD